METGLIAILITLGVIILAIKTRRCVECMLLGSLVAALVAYRTSFLDAWTTSLQDMLSENVWVFMVCLLFGSLINLLTASRGSFGFSKYMSKLCNSEKKTLFTTFVFGVIIFIDDYLNVLSIGTCMKRIYDKQKMPREALAYLLNSTAAPVCTLLPISTWAVFYANMFFTQDAVKGLGTSTAIGAYVKAIPFLFYPILTVLFVMLFSLGIIPKVGPMKKAYKRAKEEGKVYSDHSAKLNKSDIEEDKKHEGEEDGNIWYFLVPMFVLIAVAVSGADILVAVVLALATCFLIYVPRKVMDVEEFMNHLVGGFGDMLPVLTMLLVTFVLKDMCGDLGMTQYIITKVEPFLFPAIYPAAVFFLGALLAFTTGSDWGMSAIITPIVFPIGMAVGANPILVMAAVVSGGTFGSHACFYSDATLLAAQSAGIDNMEHALSQFPYALSAAILSVVLFVVCGFVF